MILLTLFYPGTIRRGFPDQKPEAVPDRPHLTDLPLDPLQCVHMEFKPLEDGLLEPVRCLKDSTVGFLCARHDNFLLNRFKSKIATLSPEELRQRMWQTDVEIAEFIIEKDRREIERNRTI